MYQSLVKTIFVATFFNIMLCLSWDVQGSDARVVAADRGCKKLLKIDFRDSVMSRMERLFPELGRKLKQEAKFAAEISLEAARILKTTNREFRYNFTEYEDQFDELGIPFLDNRSVEYVTAYRIVSNTELKDLDLNWNHRKDNSESTYEGDYVSRSFMGVFNYIYEKKSVLIQYEIPAIFLDYARFDKPEASYIISTARLNRFAMTSPAAFVARIATIESAEKITSDLRKKGLILDDDETDWNTAKWDLSKLDDTDSRPGSEVLIKSLHEKELDSPFINWLNSKDLETLIIR